MYYLGQSAIPVKPVARRTTWARGMQRATTKAYLQKTGRCPINRRGYPTSGIPVAVTRRNFFRGTALGAFTNLDLSRNPGQFELGAETPAGYGLAPLSQIQAAISAPSVVTAPAPSTVWNPIQSVLNLWDARPQALKNIRLSVDPNQAMRALQTVVKPGQISGAVDQLRAWGVTPSYAGYPVTGAQAGFGYQLAGVNWSQYLPWIIGGGAALLLLPMVMGRK